MIDPLQAEFTSKVLAAFDWLIRYNKFFKEAVPPARVAEMKQKLCQTIRIKYIDTSHHVEFQSSSASGPGESTNIEELETFQIFFPDGSLNANAGGCTSIEEFQDFAKKVTENGFTIEARSNLIREFCKEHNGDNFTKGCLLQYPYGRGGISEYRAEGRGGGRTKCIDLDTYLGCLVRLSQSQFHDQHFVLKEFNLYQKIQMLKAARYRLGKNQKHIQYVAREMKSLDIARAVYSKEKKTPCASSPFASNFLHDIDAVATKVPHTNEAAKRARTTANAMCHHFGMPSYFLTVTPDDNSSFLLQVLSGEDIDISAGAVAEATDSELIDRMKRRKALRLKVPGLCAYVFELIMDIIIEDIVGWNQEKKGIFGECQAYSKTVEEQARKTLHAHIAIWIEEFNRARENLFSPQKMVSNMANSYICKKADLVCGTSFFGIRNEKSCSDIINGAEEGIFRTLHGQRTDINNVFQHKCTVQDPFKRPLPEVTDAQGLRWLRNSLADHHKDLCFAKCPCCSHKWQISELVEAYLINGVKVPGFQQYPDRVERLKSYVIEFQRADTLPAYAHAVIEAAYNVHCHVPSSCFKHGVAESKKRKLRFIHADCRYHSPKEPTTKTAITKTGVNGSWFDWKGDESRRESMEIRVKRFKYDCFQNQSCPSITYSKAGCNNNCTPLMYGPLTVYTTKYLFKDTQKEEQEPYHGVQEAIDRVLKKTDTNGKPIQGGHYDKPSSIQESDCNKDNTPEEQDQADNDKKKEETELPVETDMTRAQRFLLLASHRHMSQNIIGASMASHLIRKHERFEFSHNFCWVPLRDMRAILEKRGFQTYLFTTETKESYLKSWAHDYLCRPSKECEQERMFNFYSEWEPHVLRATDKRVGTKQNPFYELHDSDEYPHPSLLNGRHLQVMKRRRKSSNKVMLPSVSQADFPDTASFGGNIFHESTPISSDTEDYAAAVMMLFKPFRSLKDLQIDGSYTKAFREWYKKLPCPLTKKDEQFLQNVQDSKANYSRYNSKLDHLERKTQMLQPASIGLEVSDQYQAYLEEQEEEAQQHTMDSEQIDNLASIDLDKKYLDSKKWDKDNKTPKVLKLRGFREAGPYKSGFSNLPETIVEEHASKTNFFVKRKVDFEQAMDMAEDTDAVSDYGRYRTSKNKLYQVLNIRTTSRRVQDLLRDEQNAAYPPASGSATSVMQWAKMAGLDEHQVVAFEIIVSNFLLTFHEEARDWGTDSVLLSSRSDLDSTVRGSFRKYEKEVKLLEALARKREGQKSLVGLLHGPGGSGKSRVINLVMMYAKEFSEYLEDYKFTSNTIIVTACSGVAATLLLGETAHTALLLKRSLPLDAELRQRFTDTRVIFVDEISFLSAKDLKEMHLKLGIVRDPSQAFGGIHIVFAGDYSQLEAIGSIPVYSEDAENNILEVHLNCFMELKGKHRFKDDPELGVILEHIRNGTVTSEQLKSLNDCCLVKEKSPPAGTTYACQDNMERASINNGIFHKVLQQLQQKHGNTQDAIMIFCDNIQEEQSKKCYRECTVPLKVYQEISEGHIVTDSQSDVRVDPVLKLYRNCPVMIPLNIDVPNGLANGTKATVKDIVLKDNAQPFWVTVDDTFKVKAVMASQVDFVRLEHCNKDLPKADFTVDTKSFTSVRARVKKEGRRKPEILKYKFNQIPLISNGATTVHKLQGTTLKSMFISLWTSVRWRA